MSEPQRRVNYSQTLLMFGLSLAIVPALLLASFLLVELRSNAIAGANSGLDWRVRNAATDIRQQMFSLRASLDLVSKDKVLILATEDLLFSSYAQDKLEKLSEQFPQLSALALLDAQGSVVESAPIHAATFDFDAVKPLLEMTKNNIVKQQNALPSYTLLTAPKLSRQLRSLNESAAPRYADLEQLLVLSMPLIERVDNIKNPYRIVGAIVATIELPNLISLLSDTPLVPFAETQLDLWLESRSLLHHDVGQIDDTLQLSNSAPLQLRKEGLPPISLVMSEPRSLHLEQANRAVFVTIMLVAGFILAAGIVAQLVIRRLVKPIEQLATATKQFHRGDFTPVKQNLKFNEFNQVVGLLNSMGQRISRQIAQLESAMQEARQASELKSNFLANISHEIRTPMNAIIGFCQLYPRTALSNEQTNYLDKIETASKTLLELINDVLDLSKIEANRLDLNCVPFALRSLLEEQRALYAVMAEQKGLALSLSVAPECHNTLVGDPLRLRQILHNLIGNAIKFTHSGGVWVEVTCVATGEESQTLGFCVSDQGVGIPGEAMQQLFEPFTQVDNSVTRKFGGTGLGLSICQKLVRMMGGDIRITSKVGKGTQVYFAIELPMADSWELPEISPTQVQKDLKFAEANILVVEDNELNQEVVCGFLSNAGIHYSVANNGVEALEKLEARRFDLVLMDVQMPEMDGLTATERLRADLNLTLPVIALTAHAMQEDVERCRAAGMNDHLSKPVLRQDLLRVISEWLPDKVIASNAETDEQTLPEIPLEQLDLAFAVGQFGSLDKLRRALKQFIERNRNVAHAIVEELNNGEHEALARRLHTLKGALANIGAFSLSELFKELEQQERARKLDNDDPRLKSIPANFTALERDLIALNMHSNVRPSTTRPEHAIKHGDALTLLAATREALSNSDFVDSDTLEPLTQMALDEDAREQLTRLQQALDEFDEESALSALETLATHLKAVTS